MRSTGQTSRLLKKAGMVAFVVLRNKQLPFPFSDPGDAELPAFSLMELRTPWLLTMGEGVPPSPCP